MERFPVKKALRWRDSLFRVERFPVVKVERFPVVVTGLSTMKYGEVDRDHLYR